MFEPMLQIIMNTMFGQSFRKDIDFKHEYETESGMKIDFNDRSEEYHKKIGSLIVKLGNEGGIDDDQTPKVFRMASPLQAFLSTSKKTMPFTMQKTYENFKQSFSYQDEESINVEKKKLR